MKLSLPDSVSSTQDLTELSLELHDYSTWFRREAVKSQVDGKKAEDNKPVLSASAEEIINSWCDHKPLSSQSLDMLISSLTEFASKAPVINLTIVEPPTSSYKAKLTAWCRQNIAKNILINFQFNATILGGAVLRCGSRIFDWSFRKQILAGRSKFPEVLRNVR